MREILVAPSILSADFSRLAEAVELIESAKAQLVHCDVMDGVFVPNITFGIKTIADIKKNTALPLGVHLMIVEPERYVNRFIEAGASILTIHLESSREVEKTLKFIRERGVKSGIAICPETDVSEVFAYLQLVDSVTIMGVKPGFGGQSYIKGTSERIAALSKEIARQGLAVDIEIDGGVTMENVEEIKSSGANVIVVGTAFFASKNPKETVDKIL